MATKTFCDACGKEGSVNKFNYRCHLTKVLNGQHLNGYVDNDFNHISGRDDFIDLCNKCYNDVLTPSILKLKEIMEIRGVK